MAHEASTENIVVRVLYRADDGDSAATFETNDRVNAENMHEQSQKPAWAQSIPQRRLRWLSKRHPRMETHRLRLWAS